MNLEKAKGNEGEKSNSTEVPETTKKTCFSQTPQPSLKKVGNQIDQKIEDEIKQIADPEKKTRKQKPFFFGVTNIKFFNMLSFQLIFKCNSF